MQQLQRRDQLALDRVVGAGVNPETFMWEGFQPDLQAAALLRTDSTAGATSASLNCPR